MATLRRATPADAEALTRLRAFMHASMGESVTDAWRAACIAAFRRRLGTDDFVAYLVTADGVIVSGGVGWLEEHLPSTNALNPLRGQIASMSTDPAHLRRGYARLVFEALMTWFTDRDVPRINLRATAQGRPLYEAFGFTVLGGATMAWVAEDSRPSLPA